MGGMRHCSRLERRSHSASHLLNPGILSPPISSCLFVRRHMAVSPLAGTPPCGEAEAGRDSALTARSSRRRGPWAWRIWLRRRHGGGNELEVDLDGDEVGGEELVDKEDGTPLGTGSEARSFDMAVEGTRMSRCLEPTAGTRTQRRRGQGRQAGAWMRQRRRKVGSAEDDELRAVEDDDRRGDGAGGGRRGRQRSLALSASSWGKPLEDPYPIRVGPMPQSPLFTNRHPGSV